MSLRQRGGLGGSYLCVGRNVAASRDEAVPSRKGRSDP